MITMTNIFHQIMRSQNDRKGSWCSRGLPWVQKPSGKASGSWVGRAPARNRFLAGAFRQILATSEFLWMQGIAMKNQPRRMNWWILKTSVKLIKCERLPWTMNNCIPCDKLRIKFMRLFINRWRARTLKMRAFEFQSVKTMFAKGSFHIIFMFIRMELT